MEKKKFVLRLSQDVYEKLEKWASDEFRSVNGQIEWILHESLRRHRRLKENTDTNQTELDKGADLSDSISPDNS